jgi:excinuclease ABC subunit C
VLGAFLAQFYDDKPCPRCIFISHEIEERALLAEALSTKSGYKVEVAVPRRGEKKDLVDHALANARDALARKLPRPLPSASSWSCSPRPSACRVAPAHRGL